jgi:hypothetical protein
MMLENPIPGSDMPAGVAVHQQLPPPIAARGEEQDDYRQKEAVSQAGSEESPD